MQSRSLSGMAAPPRAVFRRTDSRALRAASRARFAMRAFSRMALPTAGFSSRYSESFSVTMFLPAVLAGHLLIVLEELHLPAVSIEHSGQGPLEALLVHAALGGVDVVGEGHNGLVVAVVVLEGHLRHGVLLLPGHVDHVRVDGILGAVDKGHELPDAAGVVHGVLPCSRPGRASMVWMRRPALRKASSRMRVWMVS